jgi:hypothetical protein
MLPRARRNACNPHLQEPILKDVKGRCCLPNSPLGFREKNLLKRDSMQINLMEMSKCISAAN